MFDLNGDQWMIGGEIIVFEKWLRWLGAESYYRVSIFSGRYEENLNEVPTIYVINKKTLFGNLF